jgi:predicted solute-binding protein
MLASRCAADDAVPGKMTAHFWPLAFLGEFKFMVVPFDKIFDAVESGRADAGLIIHEGQLLMRDPALEIVDLGEWWKGKTEPTTVRRKCRAQESRHQCDVF